MNNSQIIAICLLTITLGCKDKSPRINPELIKYDWISKGDNKYFLMIQDSLMIESLTRGDFPISPYTLSNDTLIIYSQDFDYENSIPSIERVWKLKIEKVDSVELLLRPAYPNVKDTLFFRKMDRSKKNDIKIEKLEFSFSGCFGSCPAQDILINSDSMLYHYGYNSYSKHKGLSKCKLDSVQFDRIQRRIFSIERDSFRLGLVPVDAPRCYLYIKTQNDSIEINGYPEISTDGDLLYLIHYLVYIERFLNLEYTEDETIIFRDKLNSDQCNLKLNYR